MKFVEFTEKDYKIHDRKHLDQYLVKLCRLVFEGKQSDPDQYGMVAACILDPDHNVVYGINTAANGDVRKHAERVAMENYVEQYGEIPEGSIIITTLSPCNEDDTDMADERYGESCTDLINNSMVRKVYCGYIDPSQHNEHNEYTLEETSDERIKDICKKYADTFLEAHTMEDASGVIATKKQAKDPRYSTSLTVDVRPGQIEKNLKAFNLAELDVSKTLNFIKKAHSSQQYGDKPYWNHPKSVAATGKKFFGGAFGPDAIKAAFLHDVVEDTPYTLQQLGKMGFSPEVIQAVELLTKNKALSYEDNIKNIIASGNKIAMMVKYADNYQNFTGDKSSWEAKRAAASNKKYFASLNMLGDKLGVKHHIPTNEPVGENFADGKHPGRKGLAKRSGVNTKASVSSLRNTAKHSSGEKQRMAHWLANMKAGKQK